MTLMSPDAILLGHHHLNPALFAW